MSAVEFNNNIQLTYEILLIYSVGNSCIFAILLTSTAFFLSGKELRIYRQKTQVFILGFFSIFEILLLLAVFNQLGFFGIVIIQGACPWKYLRLFLTCFFIFIFCFVIHITRNSFIIKHYYLEGSTECDESEVEEEKIEIKKIFKLKKFK